MEASTPLEPPDETPIAFFCHAFSMAYSGIDALASLRSLAGPGAGMGRRLAVLGGILLVGLLLWALLVLALGQAWSFAVRALVTLLLAALAGAACVTVLRAPRG